MLGMSFGSPTVIVPQLRKEANSTAAVSKEMASWITSIGSFSAMPWTCILIVTAHYVGRKKPWHATAVVTFVAYTIVYFSKNVTHIFISQLLLGTTIGMQIALCPMILTECSSPRYRGLFLTIKTASFYWGVWIANAIGTFYNYRYIGLAGMFCSVYNFISIFFVPETPYWLAYKGRYEECVKSHRWLKGLDEDAEKELAELVKTLDKDQKSNCNRHESLLSRCKNYITIIRQPEFNKPLYLCLLIKLTYFMSGKLVYAVYAVEMLKKMTKDHSWAYNGMLILDGFSVFGMYVGCLLSKNLKRRTLLLTPSCIAALLTFSLSSYFYLVKLKLLPENNYVSLTILVVFSLATCCGPLILCSCICSELFPMKSRSFAVLCISIITNFVIGLILKVTPYCFETFSFHGTFLIFGVTFTICIILAYRYLPETKDKTLNEIAALFKKKSKIVEKSSITLLSNSVKEN